MPEHEVGDRTWYLAVRRWQLGVIELKDWFGEIARAAPGDRFSVVRAGFEGKYECYGELRKHCPEVAAWVHRSSLDPAPLIELVASIGEELHRLPQPPDVARVGRLQTQADLIIETRLLEQGHRADRLPVGDDAQAILCTQAELYASFGHRGRPRGGWIGKAKADGLILDHEPKGSKYSVVFPARADGDRFRAFLEHRRSESKRGTKRGKARKTAE